MVEASLLANSNVKEATKFEPISAIKCSQDVQALWGINNFIAKVEANSKDLLSDIISTDLKLAIEVSKVLTLLMTDSQQSNKLR